MKIDTLTWLLTLGSLLGGQLVINKNKLGYVVWGVVNTLWFVYFLHKNIYSSSALFLIYLIQAIYGYIKWKKNEKNN